MLDGVNPLHERGARLDGDRLLADDGAGVEALVDVVDGDTGRLDACSERVLDRPRAWERPPVFAWLLERGVEEEELRRVFNVGIGMCAVVPEAPPDALVIGELA